MSLASLLEIFDIDAVRFGPSGLDGHVESLNELIESGHGPSPAQGEALLKLLRGHRCYSTMLDVADSLKDSLTPMGRIYEVQAFIDQSRLSKARQRLEGLHHDYKEGRLDGGLPDEAGPREKARQRLQSEILGLLGRLYKQYFVTSTRSGKNDAPDHLIKAMYYHNQGYPLDPAWHGANLAALAWRAGEENIAIGNLPSAAEIGTRLEATQRAIGPIESLGPWDVSALAQARMAQNDWNGGLELYQVYVRKLAALIGDGAAFMLMADLRQLQEIWLIDKDGEGPRDDIIRELSMRILANPDGTVSLSFDALESLNASEPSATSSELQALLDGGGSMLAAIVVKNLTAQLDSICRVRGLQNQGLADKGGTGFIVAGESVGSSNRGPVLVTNSHVLSNHPTSADTLLPSVSEVEFEMWKPRKTLNLGDLIWESPPGEYDISIWNLLNTPDDIKLTSVSRSAAPFPKPNNDLNQGIGSVFPIGHPGGRGLTVSFGGGSILDHDLHQDPGSVRLIHYKANTEHGSSGSPVFDRSGNVVAIHRAFAKKQISGSPKIFTGEYAANEGVGIHAVARACRQSISNQSTSTSG